MGNLPQGDATGHLAAPFCESNPTKETHTRVVQIATETQIRAVGRTFSEVRPPLPLPLAHPLRRVNGPEGYLLRLRQAVPGVSPVFHVPDPRP
jgi:hypothetical protein